MGSLTAVRTRSMSAGLATSTVTPGRTAPVWSLVRSNAPAGSALDKPRPAYPGEPGGKYQTVTTFDKDGTGRWVVFAIVAHRSQSC